MKLPSVWLYQGQMLLSIPEGIVGFVYCITVNATGQKYIGKKSVVSRTSKRKPGKTRRTWTTKESDWRNYYSSSAEVKDLVNRLGPGAITREVLHLCASKGEMSYLETAEQFRRDVLYARLPDGRRAYLNNTIAGRWFAEKEAA